MTIEQNDKGLERALTDLVDIGRMWASSGLTMGKIALENSAKSLDVAAGALGELVNELENAAPQPHRDDDAVGAERTATAGPVTIPEKLVDSVPECDNREDESDADSGCASS
jgi:hypothetical protein